ncbi:unnamed protein product [Alopecurus aequalis]
MVLEQFFGYLRGKRHGAKKAMRELEITLLEDTELYKITMNAAMALVLNFAATGTLVWFATRKGPKLLGTPPMCRALSFGYSMVCGSTFGGMRHHEFYQRSVADVLEGGEEHMKMELVKIILNNHSTDNLLVEAVKRNFIAENLLSDQHQEQPLFRWRQRNSFVDYSFRERMKESEANNSDEDEAESSVNTRLFKGLSLACVPGTPGDKTEISKPSEETGGTILTRRELQVHRRPAKSPASASPTC